MGRQMFNAICSLRTAAAIGLAACFVCWGELRGQQNPNSTGVNRTTAAIRPAVSPASGRRTSGTSAGSRQLGSGVPGFASGGAAATRARNAAAAQGRSGLPTPVYYGNPSGAQQSLSGTGLNNAAGAPATAIAPPAATDKTAGQVFTPSGSAAQALGPALLEAGAGGFIPPGELAVAFNIDRAPPDQVGFAIGERLSKMPSLHFLSELRVDMIGGTAILRGTVASEHDRDLAARVVLLEAGVDRVVNLLVVRKPAVPSPPVPASPVPKAPVPGISARSTQA